MGSKVTLALVLVVAALGSGTANAMVNSTSQGLKADGLRLQGMAQRYEGQAAINTSDGRLAEGQRWEAIADFYRRLNNSPAASFYTPEALRAESQRWQAMANSYGRVAVAAGSSSGFDWSDAGIGAAGGLGVAMFAAALILTARRVRRTKLAL
jgi:hypothetical protein